MTTPLNYFAVELRRLTAHAIVEKIMRDAKAGGLLFDSLDSLGSVDIAGKMFARFRADLVDPMQVLKPIFDEGHGIVFRGPEGFEGWLADRKGKVSSITMVGSPVTNLRKYKGPKHRLWERQFSA